MAFPRFLPAVFLIAGAAFIPIASAQQFTQNTTDIPASTGSTENVDFADVDLDGDWDAVFANGGDDGNQQSTIWINKFNLADPVGKFTNRTAVQFPADLHDSRDIEFVDFDADGDHDIYLSDTAQLTPQSNRWWTNVGNAQALTIGTYVDQTAARWSGLGAAGSSIAPGQLIDGGFIDFSCDCDFGDLDNDGDLDLVHSTYGGQFGGQVPTRLFLNNGAGVFSEFNPSGFQLSAQTISNGNPGIWCEGTQSSNTTNSTGTNCDVSSTALDIDLGDIDGDFDLDILHGARQEQPRMFKNRLAETGALAFRDVTGATFPVGYSTGDGHYEQEMGDQDGDGDLDIYGLNWLQGGPNFTDLVMKNTGVASGTFASIASLSGSNDDDNEGDYIDYDNDGDLDLLIANFSGQERVYTNNGSGTYALATGVLPSDGTTSLDADICDVDADGDYDAFVANDGGQSEWYLQNTTTANDVSAPVIPTLEQAPVRVASLAPTVVRAAIRDNAPYYTVWYLNHRLDVTVNAGPVASYPMRTSQGDIYRGVIPGHLEGTICYQVVSVDQYGNTGTSVQKCYTASAPQPGTAYCFGDGTGTACPCSPVPLVGDADKGCPNSFNAGGGKLTASGIASISNDSLVMTCTTINNGGAVVFQGTNNNGGGLGAAFGDGLRCAAGAVMRMRSHAVTTNTHVYPDPMFGDNAISIRGAVAVPGDRYYQGWYRSSLAHCDPAANYNLTNGVKITWVP